MGTDRSVNFGGRNSNRSPTIVGANIDLGRQGDGGLRSVRSRQRPVAVRGPICRLISRQRPSHGASELPNDNAKVIEAVTAGAETGRSHRRRVALLRIAATALANGLALYTRHPDDFARAQRSRPRRRHLTAERSPLWRKSTRFAHRSGYQREGTGQGVGGP